MITTIQDAFAQDLFKLNLKFDCRLLVEYDSESDSFKAHASCLSKGFEFKIVTEHPKQSVEKLSLELLHKLQRVVNDLGTLDEALPRSDILNLFSEKSRFSVVGNMLNKVKSWGANKLNIDQEGCYTQHLVVVCGQGIVGSNDLDWTTLNNVHYKD